MTIGVIRFNFQIHNQKFNHNEIEKINFCFVYAVVLSILRKSSFLQGERIGEQKKKEGKQR